MINVSNQILGLLLGWVRGLAASLWGAVTGGTAGALLGWLSANWLPLTVLLCLFGLLADLLVYLLRWQPYKVIQSFFRRQRQRRERRAVPPAAPAEPADTADVSASGRHRRVEKPRRAAPAWVERMTERLSAQEDQGSLLRRRRVDTGIQREAQFNDPYYPPQYRQPGDTGTLSPRPRRRRGGGAS